MQHRMRDYPLSPEEIQKFLAESQAGTIATVGPDGVPYCVPVHFVYVDGAVYFHGLPAGQKLDYIRADPKVCFTVYELHQLLMDLEERPCFTDTAYTSVVIQGKAALLTDLVEKERALMAIVQKYTPQLVEKGLPEARIRGTAVVKITIEHITGKYYRW